MDVSEERLRSKYASLDDSSILKINNEKGLTDTAKKIIKEELSRRNLSDQIQKVSSPRTNVNSTFFVDFINSIKNSVPLPKTKRMIPSLYLSIFLIPIVYFSAAQMSLFDMIQSDRSIFHIIAYLPILGIFLFMNKAYYVLEKDYGILKPKLRFLILIPFINLIYQYFSIHSLGQKIRKAISISNHSDIKFVGLLSELYCHLFIVLNIASQINIHIRITNQKYSFKIILLEWIARGLWIYITTLMIWDYSKIINLLGKEKRGN